MSSTSDSGHDSNVASLQALNTAITYMGAGYNPAPVALKLTALQTMHAGAQSRLDAISIAHPVWSTKVHQRAAKFEQMLDRATRSVNTLVALSPQSPALPMARNLLKKLRGKRISATPLNPDGTPAPTISMSQQSYDDKEKLFKDLVNVLKTDPLYLPDDAELTIAALETFADELEEKNTAVVNARTPLDNARTDRDAFFYDPVTGVVVVGQQAKTYIKGKFGASSPQYKQVSGLKFRNLMKK